MTELEEQLFDAIKGGDISKVESLITQGANLNARDEWGHTALHAASFGGVFQ